MFGYSDQFDYVKVYENDWIQNELEVIGVRTKAVELDYEQYLGRKYDWFPFCRTNKNIVQN